MPRVSFDPENVIRETMEIEVLKIPVTSESRPDITHYVSLAASCTCEGFRYHAKCKHITEILSQLTEAEPSIAR